MKDAGEDIKAQKGQSTACPVFRWQDMKPIKGGKVKKIKRTTLKNKADKLFADKVKSAGFCQKCGKTSNLQCAHIISRSYHGTRWNLRNAVCLCARCHVYFTHRPLEWEDWVNETFGLEYYNNLKQLALLHLKEAKTIDYEVIIKELTNANKPTKKKCPYCKETHLMFPGTVWIQCVCGARYDIQNQKWLTTLEQMNQKLSEGKKVKCNDNLASCFCEKREGHKGLHVCRCGGSWDNEGMPHTFPNIFLGLGAFPLSDEEEEIVELKRKAKQ